MRRKEAKRVMVIGLDCATPQFVFGPDRFDMPNIGALATRGCWGSLRSCHPPITVPAWASMMSGKDPGTLGFYGFRNRKDYSYSGMSTANSTAVREQRVWDILSRNRKKVILLGVPQTYPVTPVNGWMIADFLTPDTQADYTYPKALRREIEVEVGEYIIDVKDFRTEEKDRLLANIYALMNNRFDLARWLLDKKPWDFFMMVEMGLTASITAFGSTLTQAIQSSRKVTVSGMRSATTTRRSTNVSGSSFQLSGKRPPYLSCLITEQNPCSADLRKPMAHSGRHVDSLRNRDHAEPH